MLIDHNDKTTWGFHWQNDSQLKIDLIITLHGSSFEEFSSMQDFQIAVWLCTHKMPNIKASSVGGGRFSLKFDMFLQVSAFFFRNFSLKSNIWKLILQCSGLAVVY